MVNIQYKACFTIHTYIPYLIADSSWRNGEGLSFTADLSSRNGEGLLSPSFTADLSSRRILITIFHSRFIFKEWWGLSLSADSSSRNGEELELYNSAISSSVVPAHVDSLKVNEHSCNYNYDQNYRRWYMKFHDVLMYVHVPCVN